MISEDGKKKERKKEREKEMKEGKKEERKKESPSKSTAGFVPTSHLLIEAWLTFARISFDEQFNEIPFSNSSSLHP